MFAKQKLGDILNSFTKLTNQLQKFIDNSDKDINNCRHQMSEAEDRLDAHVYERDKAKRVMANVQKLIEE